MQAMLKQQEKQRLARLKKEKEERAKRELARRRGLSLLSVNTNRLRRCTWSDADVVNLNLSMAIRDTLPHTSTHM